MSEQLSGKELDLAIAKHVMGWPVYIQPDSPEGNDDWHDSLTYPCIVVHQAGGYWLERSSGEWESIDFRPHQSIEAAMQVVEKLRRDGFSIDMRAHRFNCSETEWIVAVNEHGKRTRTHSGYANALSEAICRAALKAIGAKE